MSTRLLVVGFLAGLACACSDDPIESPYAFRLDTDCAGATNTGTYQWESGSSQCTSGLLSGLDCTSGGSGREVDVANPDVEALSGGSEDGGGWVVHVFLVGRDGPPCAVSKAHRSDECARGGVTCTVTLTPL